MADNDAAVALLEGVEHPALVDWGRAPTPDEAVVLLAGGGALEPVATRSPKVVMVRLEP